MTPERLKELLHQNLSFSDLDDAIKLVDKLIERDEKLAALEVYGVDNWQGYDEAMRDLRKHFGEGEADEA